LGGAMKECPYKLVDPSEEFCERCRRCTEEGFRSYIDRSLRRRQLTGFLRKGNLNRVLQEG